MNAPDAAIDTMLKGGEFRLRDLHRILEDAAFVARFGKDPAESDVRCNLCGLPFKEHQPSDCDTSPRLAEAERLLREWCNPVNWEDGSAEVEGRLIEGRNHLLADTRAFLEGTR